jgi:diguanylate cyclase (GGDEF)-like protein/PAS domain S-box-containing protein
MEGMPLSSRLGLALKSEHERELLRSVAQENGFEPIDAPFRIDHPARRPWLIVTDDPAAGKPGEDKASSPEFWESVSPLVILVRNEGSSDTRAENGGHGIEDAWVLERPLQRKAITAVLRQAAQTIRIFEQWHSSMLEEHHRMSSIFNSVSNGITISDATLPDLPLIYVNPAFERMTGYLADEVCGRNCRFLQGSDNDQPGLTKVREAIRESRDVRALLRNYRKDGSLFWNELYLSPISDLEGRLTHFVGIQNEVTAQVESSERLDYLAHHDALTGLANRGLLMEQLKQALLRARRSGGIIAVLFFDIDNFKHVNDVFGHDVGDSLLQEVAHRLRAGARDSDTVARLGGDEFVIVLEELSDEHQATESMRRLTSMVKEQVNLVGEAFRPCASVGMALFPTDGDSAEVLLKVADFKMYAAKHAARIAGECDDDETTSGIKAESRTDLS